MKLISFYRQIGEWKGLEIYLKWDKDSWMQGNFSFNYDLSNKRDHAPQVGLYMGCLGLWFEFSFYDGRHTDHPSRAK